MKKFAIQNLFLENDNITCSPSTFPDWLKHKDIKWFVDKHILTMKIGESIETDFHIITRVK